MPSCGLGASTYKTNLVWHKIRNDGGSDGRGVGFYFRNVTELVLFGLRGKHARTLDPGRRQVNYLESKKREHSRKPDELYPIIEACSPGPYVSKIKGVHLGEAIVCPYARLPGGCGQTIHCRSCTVRLTIHDTYTTGRSHYDVPAYQDVCFAREVKTICFLISTEKSGEFVLLKIHEVKDKKCEEEKQRKKV